MDYQAIMDILSQCGLGAVLLSDRDQILRANETGIHLLHGEGGYTGEPSEVLLSVISNRELPRLEKLVHSIDPACFLIVSRVTEVSGRGFSMEKEYQ